MHFYAKEDNEKVNTLMEEYEEKAKKILFMISYRKQEVLYKKELYNLGQDYNKLARETQKKNCALINEISEIEKKSESSFMRFFLEKVKHIVVVVFAKVKVFWSYKYVLE